MKNEVVNPVSCMGRLFSLENKKALVTGGSRGIGYMIAQGLLEAGATVYITVRNSEACETAARKLSAFGQCYSLAGNITEQDTRDKIGETIDMSEGHLDILVNNAGAGWGDSYENYPVSGFDKVLVLNEGIL